MSLKSRLRVSIVGLVITVVVALSALYLRTLVDTMFTDIEQRGRMVATDAAGMVLLRVREQSAGLPPPVDMEEARRRWETIVRQDSVLPAMFGKMLSNTRATLEIVVVSESDEVLTGGFGRSGAHAHRMASFERWQQRPFWERLWDVWFTNAEYGMSVAMGASDPATGTDPQPVFRIEAVISSVLIRDMLKPPLVHLGWVSLLSLIVSLTLAVGVTRFVSRPLERMARQIDQIAAGAAPQPEPEKPAGSSRMASREFAVMESKLAMLGQQYRGAQADAMQLRSNLEVMLERLEQAVLLTDAQGRVSMVGPSTERMVGRRRTDLLGAPIESVFPPDTPLGALLLHAIHRTEKLRDYPVALDRPAQSPLRALLNVEPLAHIDTGQPQGVMITLRDAETRHQLESQFDIAARLAAINRVTGGVAHEIKNPLNAIALHLEVLRSKLRDFDGADNVDGELKVIAREIMRLDRVVKTFLDFTRPVELEVRDVDLEGVARQVATLVSPQAATREVRLELEVSGRPALVAGDRDMLMQAVLNVVNNAVESMTRPGTVRIGVEAAAPADWCLKVTDEGCGIPPEKREKVFDLYYTTKTSGSGIGLAMTFRVVQLHHGRIDVASEVGRGTTFELAFPAVSPSSSSMATTAAAVASNGAALDANL